MKKAFGFFSLVALLSGCSTDFDTIAPYKETMVVYGLLNPNDSIQYIRIAKAYLGEGNALVMATQADSIYYSDILDVKIERILNNAVVETHNLVRLDTVPKETEGTFAAPYQVVYADVDSLPQAALSDGSVYKLTVFNRLTGNTVTASTELFDFVVQTPTPLSNPFNLTSGVTSLIWKVIPDPKGKVYGMTQYINYSETDTTTMITTPKSIRWYLGDKTPSGSATISFSSVKSDFYRLLGENIAINPVMKRQLSSDPLDLYVSAGTEELYTYMQVSEQNTGIVQDRPLYSNIVNGLGLFTCRNTKKIKVHFTSDSYTALDTSVYTKDLNFQ